MSNVLVIDGHPDPASLTARLATSYASGAGAGAVPLVLRDLDFDLSLRTGYRTPQDLEPDLARAQELLEWADHVTVFTPLWWAPCRHCSRASSTARSSAGGRSATRTTACPRACSPGAPAGSR